MKMMSMLDMSGNQIQNFLVHNGNVSGTGALTAQAGKLAYNLGDRSLYYGYDNSTDGNGGNLLWSRLVDVAHLGQAMADDDVYAWAKKVSGSKITVDEQTYTLGAQTVVNALQMGGNAYAWGDHGAAGYAKVYRMNAEEIEDAGSIIAAKYDKSKETSFGLVFDESRKKVYHLCVATNLEYNGKTYNGAVYHTLWDEDLRSSIYSIDVLKKGIIIVEGRAAYVSIMNNNWALVGDGSLLAYLKPFGDAGVSTDYLYSTLTDVARWGNHADFGYSKAYKVSRAISLTHEESDMRVFNDLDALIMGVAGSNANSFVDHGLVFDDGNYDVLKAYAHKTSGITYYVRKWQPSGSVPSSQYVKMNGVMLFVTQSAKVYCRVTGEWVEYFSGANEAVVGRIDDIIEALGLDTDPTGGEDRNIIDTWNGMQEFFSNVDSGETLMGAIATKANDADVLKKPVNRVDAGSVYTAVDDNGRFEFAVRKIVERWTPGSNRTKTINISNLGTADVVVKLYVKNTSNPTQEAWDEIMADVKVRKGISNSQIAVDVTFGGDVSSEVKAVITN